jgi:hypothetical protein
MSRQPLKSQSMGGEKVKVKRKVSAYSKGGGGGDVGGGVIWQQVAKEKVPFSMKTRILGPKAEIRLFGPKSTFSVSLLPIRNRPLVSFCCVAN